MASEEQHPPGPGRAARRLRTGLAILGGVLALLVALAGWLLGTGSGARAAFSMLSSLPAVALHAEGIHGRLAGPLRVDRLSLDSEGQRVTLDRLQLDWRPRALLDGRLHVNSLRIGKLAIVAKEQQKKKEPAQLPDKIALPLRLRLDTVQVDSGEFRNGPVSMAEFGPLAFNLDFDGSRYLLRLERLAVRRGLDGGSVGGGLQGEATLSATRPYPLRAQLSTGAEAAIGGQALGASGQIGIDGSLAEMALSTNLRVNASTIKGRVVLRPFSEQALGIASLRAQDINLSDFSKKLPKTELNISLSAMEDGTGELVATNADAGPYNEKKVPLADLRILFRQQAGQFDFNRIHTTLGSVKQPAGVISGSGRYAGGTLKLDLGLNAIDLRGLDRRMQPTRLAGRVGILQQSGRQEFTVDLTEPRNKQKIALAAHAVLADSRLAVDRAELSLGAGRIQASGHLDLSGAGSFGATGDVARFRLKDVGNFAQLPDLYLNGNFSLQGARQPQLVADLAFAITDSRLEGQPLQGEGKAQLRADSIDISTFYLAAGANRLNIEGQLTQSGGQLSFALAAPKLEQLGRGLGGALQANGVARGSFSRPRINASWNGNGIRLPDELRIDGVQGKADLQLDRAKPFSLVTAGIEASVRGVRSGEQQLTALSAQLQFSPQPDGPLRLTIQGQGAQAGGQRLDSFGVSASGTTADHTLNLTVAEPGQNWTLDASGGLGSLASAPQWQGRIQRLVADGRFIARLDAPAPLLVSQDRVQLDRFRLDAALAYIEIEQFLRDPRGIVTRGSIERLQVAQLLQFAAREPAIKTDLQLSGDWNVSLTDAPSGTVRIRRDSGDLVIQGGKPVALGLRALEATANASDGQIEMQLRAEGQQLGLIDANGRIRTAGGGKRFSLPSDTPVTASIKIDIPSLGWAGPLISPTTVVDGRLQSAITIGGTLSQPRLGGRIAGNGLRFMSIDTGIDLRQGVLESEFEDSQLVLRTLRFQNPDGGALVASGRVALADRQPSAQIAVKAERFALFDRSDRKLRLSGQSQVIWRDARATIKGAFTVDSGFFDIGSTGMPRLSDDVVIVGQTQKAPEKRGFPATIDVSVSLGKGVELRGRGLNALLAGQVRLAGEAGEPLRANGTLRIVKGTFSAYGRELKIEQGVLRFNGPINNPSLDILAMRRGQEVEAGVAVRGTVLAPRVTLVSEPPVPEAEKLSWLVLGRGLAGVGEGEMGTLQSAAGALLSQGAAAGVQSQIAGALGLDELSLGKTEDSLQERIVTFGKQVSSRLYVSLERGLETASNVLHLRYTLSPKLTLEAETGTRSALSLFYNIAFD